VNAGEAADRSWAAVKSAVGSLESLRSIPEEQSAAHWTSVTKTCRAEFQKLARVDLSGGEIRSFVRKFGAEGAVADFAWFLSFSEGMLNWRGPGGLHQSGRSEFRRLQLITAEAQIELFLEKPELLKRYCHLILWSGCLNEEWGGYWLRHIEVSTKDQETIGWGARDALVAMSLTGRADLFRDAKSPKVIRDCYRKWFDWVWENGGYLTYRSDRQEWEVSVELKEAKLGYVPFLKGMQLAPFRSLNKPFADWPMMASPDPFLIRQIDD
jgi:hypothetical protein